MKTTKYNHDWLNKIRYKIEITRMLDGTMKYRVFRKIGRFGFWKHIDFDKDAARQCNIYNIPETYYDIESAKQSIIIDYKNILKTHPFAVTDTIWSIDTNDMVIGVDSDERDTQLINRLKQIQ